MGENVRVSPVAVAHGNLRIEIRAEARTIGVDAKGVGADGKTVGGGDPFVSAEGVDAAAGEARAASAASSVGGAGKKPGHIQVINKGASIADSR